MAFGTGNFERDLIFDVGAANGEDSAYYLHKGYRVVAVEPNPLSASLLRERFSREIETGRLRLVEAAISDREGKASFWICDDIPSWSSFDRAIASYANSRHHCISVQTRRLASLLERFGTPFYCKIDIEGSDRQCLEDLDEAAMPAFLSIELPTIGSAPRKSETGSIMERLESLGYDRFKVISQVTYRQPGRLLPAIKARLPSFISRRVTLLDKAFRKYRADRDWRFGEESSGPFAEMTRGSWLTAGQARKLIVIIQRNIDISEWYDIHAAAPISR